MRKSTAAVLIWVIWLLGFGPLLAWLIPFGKASNFGLYAGGALLLAYFFAPSILLTRFNK